MADLGMSPHTDLGHALEAVSAPDLTWQITRHAENFAVKMALVTPAMKLFLIESMFAEVGRWLDESGVTPDLAEWFAGAQAYVIPMVPPEHREETLSLLDFESLDNTRIALEGHARLEGLRSAVDDTAPSDAPMTFEMFNLREPVGTLWFGNAIMADTVVAHHAACALVAWIHEKPGAVVDPPAKAMDIADRTGLLKDAPGKGARR